MTASKVSNTGGIIANKRNSERVTRIIANRSALGSEATQFCENASRRSAPDEYKREQVRMNTIS
jgi:16S rRNA C967 or C1407 C5-methylase (RsmB/RsmF family)